MELTDEQRRLIKEVLYEVAFDQGSGKDADIDQAMIDIENILKPI